MNEVEAVKKWDIFRTTVLERIENQPWNINERSLLESEGKRVRKEGTRGNA